MPVENHFVVTYEGGDADRYLLDMRQLGESLVGIERLLNAGLYLVEHGKRPGHGRVLQSVIHVSALRPGSFEIVVGLTYLAAQVYPILSDAIFQVGISRLLRNLVSTPVLGIAGQKEEALLVIPVVDRAEARAERREKRAERREEREHKERMAQLEERKQLYELLTHQWAYTSIRQAVSPVGRSCDCMRLFDGEEQEEITPPIADAIRSKGSVEIGAVEVMAVQVDGFIHRTRQLRVVHSEVPHRLLKAYVRDPAFESTPNIYTEAASSQNYLIVHARSVRKGGKLVAIEIMGEAGA